MMRKDFTSLYNFIISMASKMVETDYGPKDHLNNLNYSICGHISVNCDPTQNYTITLSLQMTITNWPIFNLVPQGQQNETNNTEQIGTSKALHIYIKLYNNSV